MPRGEIKISNQSWNSLKKVNFDLYFNEAQNVEITASDNSGEVTIQYYLSDKSLKKSDLEKLNNYEWEIYSESFVLEPDRKVAV
ncbi:hypothetical protein, partial [Candidatus Methanomassiliicoccus intestinalis]|uniref:hypothetical protein n=1 Tax=Candidatus Methanomassiliicoccus intestinalis TaxID=1406512 RepID=UPI0037DC1A91